MFFPFEYIDVSIGECLLRDLGKLLDPDLNSNNSSK